MPRRPRQPKLEPLGEILGKVLKKRRIPHTASDRRLVELWQGCVGPSIAAQTHPESVKRGILYVRVSAPVWMHQLQFLKEEIIEKLHRMDPPREIRGLFFSVGELPPVKVPADRHAPASSPAAFSDRDRDMMQESLASIADPELREILARVMAAEIGRRRRSQRRRASGR
jgi:predicted nucleic acid-binding Zn ribbon protein